MSNIRAEVLKLAKGNVYEEHLKFISTFDEKWRTDDNIILLMCAIVLFTPTRSSTIHTDVIRLEQVNSKNIYYWESFIQQTFFNCRIRIIIYYVVIWNLYTSVVKQNRRL